MRELAVAIVVCGCSASHAQVQTDAPPTPVDTVDAAWGDNRRATAIVAGPDRILWTQRHGTCSLEFGCDVDVAPTLTMVDRSSGTVTTLFADNWGADALAGDETEVFMLLAGDDEFTRVLARFRPGVSTTPEVMSAPLVDPTGLVADATYVYWVAGHGLASSVYRASRAGDGSDATAIHSGDTFVPVVAFGGYLWSGGLRLPVGGGTVEDMLPGGQVFAASTSAGLLATKNKDAAGSSADVGILAPDFSFHVLFPDVEQPYVPQWQPVADADELFWTGSTHTLFRGRLTDTMFHADSRYNGEVTEPFAVTSDAILSNFTRRGFDSIPR